MKHFSSPRRNKPISLLGRLFVVFSVVGLLSVAAVWATTTFSSTIAVVPPQINVLELWKTGAYDEIIANGTEELKLSPMDAGTLVFSGFSYFHKGVAEISVEKKLPLINAAIVDLRKALLVPQVPLVPQIHYILGKAYFHKGKFFADLAIEHLKKAQDLGYTASDINEYLGLSYSLVGRYSEAADQFLDAVGKTPSDLLLWTLGETYFQMQQMDKAIVYLGKAIDKTKDRGLEQRCRFLLGDIYTRLKQFDQARDEYNTILSRNNNSADAHFFLGEIENMKGNKEAARAEWRKAFKIDPLHFNANQRLFN
jgi:tetratricopeptide (TPR) repeat protein